MDNELLAAASTEHKAMIWSLKTMRNTFTFPGHKETINACKFSFVTKSLLTGSQDRTIKIWDIEKGNNTKNVSVIRYYETRYRSCASHLVLISTCLSKKTSSHPLTSTDQ